jgi:hypothetical protein
MGFAADFPRSTKLRLQRSRLRRVKAQEFWFQFERYPYRAVPDAIIWQVHSLDLADGCRNQGNRVA